MKAHISVIEMDRDGLWKLPVKVLERDYHLSYPFLFEWNGNLYMIPETKGNKAIELYRCTRFPNKWEIRERPCGRVQAVDSTLSKKMEFGGSFAILAARTSRPMTNYIFLQPNTFGAMDST